MISAVRKRLLELALKWSLVLFTTGVLSAAKVPPLQQSPPRFFTNATFVTAICAEKYTCSNNTEYLKECSCHPNCSLFDSCCSNVRRADWLQRSFPKEMYQCVPALQLSSGVTIAYENAASFDSIYIVTLCPAAFNATWIGDLCHHPLELKSNGTLSVLVTHDDSGVTYRNIYCAVCNGVNHAYLSRWTPFYVRSQSSPNETAEVGYAPPENISLLLHGCRENSVQSCPKNLCSDGSDCCADGPVRFVYDVANKVAYRNWDCTRCSASPSAATFQCSAWPLPLPTINLFTQDFSVSVDPDYRCPQNRSVSPSKQEQAFWQSVCSVAQGDHSIDHRWYAGVENSAQPGCPVLLTALIVLSTSGCLLTCPSLSARPVG